MKRPNRVKLILFVVTSGLWAGCESNWFDPPRPAELDVKPSGGTITNDNNDPVVAVRTDLPGPGGRLPSSESEPGSRVKGIELILARPITTDREYLTQILRKEAGKRKLAFRLTKPEAAASMTAARMAGAIRAAAELRYAVILEPLAGPEVCAALRSFKATGLGLLLLDEPVSCPGAPVAIDRILFTGFADRGAAIVEAALEEAAFEALPADLTIVILRNRTIDAYSSQRRASLEKVLEARKRQFEAVEFEGSETEAYLRLMEYLQSHPRRPIVLAEDHAALLGAYKAHAELTERDQPAFVLAGYALSDVRIGFPGHVACVGFAYQDLDAYSRKAAAMVVQMSDGKSVPPETLCDVPFVRTLSGEKPGTAGGKSRP